MHTDWQDFRNELSIKDDIDPEKTPLLAFPEGLAVLSVTGDDRQAFLHGQLINDLNLIVPTGAQLSGWCNPKGQLISNFLVVNTGTAYLLLFRQELKQYVLKRLSMFVLRANVTIEDITDSTPVLGVANCEDIAVLGPDIDATAGAVSAADGIVIVCLPDASQRFLLLGNVETQIAKTTALQQSLTPASAEIWALLDIMAGMSWLGTATQEKFLPQMLNLDALNGLSYQKGCYPGQEVIARLHYRGEVKRRLQLITAKTDLSEGTTIKTAQDDNAGMIVNAVTHPTGGSMALAVLDLDKLDGELFPETGQGSAIQIQNLPYAID